MSINFLNKAISISLLLMFLLITLQCASNSDSTSTDAANLPKDILGLRLGMGKEDAEKRLTELGEFSQTSEKGQQLWNVKNDPRFNSIAVGFDRKDGRLNFVTAFSEKERVSERVLFTEVGDVSKAKNEVMPPHHRYTWKIEATEDNPTHYVSVYGADPEYLSMYSIFVEPSKERKEEE